MSEFYERCEGVNLWINIVLTVLISPSLLIGKILWDRCNNRRNDTVIMKNKLQLKNTSEKLRTFYWPLYIRLVKNYSIWVKLLEGTYTEDLVPTASSGDDVSTICKHIDSLNNPCQVPIHQNNGVGLCLYHTHARNQRKLVNVYDDNLIKYFKIKLLDNYSEINKLIIDNIYISEPNTQLGKLLIFYMKFILVMTSQLETNQSLNMREFNMDYPHRLLPLIEKKLFNLQKVYNKLLQNYYYKA